MLQYKTEKDGVIETRIEKRLVISGTAADVDHDQVQRQQQQQQNCQIHTLTHLLVNLLAGSSTMPEPDDCVLLS